MKKLTKQQKEILRDFVKHTCEQCNKDEYEVGTLEVHRINRGQEYNLRNIKLLCKRCHDLYHSNEFRNVRSR